MPSILINDDKCPVTKEYIHEILKSPESVLQSDASVADKILNVSKWLFDKSKKYGESFSPLPELMIDGFDENQIWEQMLLEFEPKLAFFENLIADAEKEMQKEMSDDNEEEEEVLEEDILDETIKESGIDEDLEESGDDEDLEESGDEIEFDQDEQQEFNEEEEEMEDYDQASNSEESGDEDRGHRNGVDDDFFSLDAMEKFADAMDKREEDGQSQRDSESEMDFIDSELLFQDPDALVEGNEIENANDIRYEDFFGSSKKPVLSKKHSKEKEFLPPVVEEEHVPSNDNVQSLDLDDESDSEGKEEKSRFEKQQEKLQKVIKELEAEAVAEKDWTLKGEVDASKRPKNSLLEQTLDVDYASKPVPVVTEESTASLEDIIKQRIKDELWDDVVRKIIIPERETDPTKTREPNDTKNAKSLTQVYEEEYLRQTQDESFKSEKDESLEKEHDEINQLFNGLSQALDALSNAYFTPKAPVLEVRVLPKLDVPAISMEEVIPANISDAKLVTPEEVYSTKIKKSEEEKNIHDRKRDRANFKAQQKKLRDLKEKARKDAEVTKSSGRKRLSDEQSEKNKALEELMGQQNVTIISDSKNKQKLESQKGIKASVIKQGGKVQQEVKRFKTEHIKL